MTQETTTVLARHGEPPCAEVVQRMSATRVAEWTTTPSDLPGVESWECPHGHAVYFVPLTGGAL